MHQNNFTVLRLFAASLVIVGHAFDLQRQSDFARHWTGYSLGEIAVAAFFSISGYLVFNSIVRRPDVIRYARSRALRILPGLWVMLIVTWLAGALWSFLPPAEYFRDPTGWKYIGFNALTIPVWHYLPRVFEGNPFGPVVNGSLWTMRYEVLCYAGLGLLCAAGVLATPQRRRLIILCALIASAAWFIGLAIFGKPASGPLVWAYRLNQLGFAFLVGMAIAEFKISVRAWHVATATCAVIVLHKTFLIWPALCLLSAAFVFWFAFLDAPALRRLRETPDISFGVYIYAFPIQQAVIFSIGVMPPLLHAAIAVLLTIIPAALSWYFVEKPALRWKSQPTDVTKLPGLEPSKL